MDVVVIRGNRDPSRPEALVRAAERWGSARIEWRACTHPRKPKGQGKHTCQPWTRRAIQAFRCPVCSKRVAFGRGKTHIAEHLRST